MTKSPGEHRITVQSPVPDLLYRKLVATERLGRLFEFRVELLAEDPAVDTDKLLGEGMSVTVDSGRGAERHFHGIVTEFAQTGEAERMTCYTAVLRPWLWLLTRTADCRIFQAMTVPDILDKVFRDHGFTDFSMRLTRSDYRTWDYCVQYRETDFNFVSRLMEQEGIHYYFEHDGDKHTLCIADSNSSRGTADGAATLPFLPPSEHRAALDEYVSSWRMSRTVQTGIYALNDFDFRKPTALLETKSAQSRSHAHGSLETYDYPGEYEETAEGNAYAKVRIEEAQARFEIVEATTNALALTAGHTFTLDQHPRDDQNAEHLVVAATHRLREEHYETQAKRDATADLIVTTFQTIPSTQPYRSPRSTPKPVIQGPQTAIVTGKSGEEIWTDEHGRVKVRFPWDRAGKKDETSSCWIRVAQYWAGKQWGSIHVPRIGQEVIVEFLEGDPDRPIVTGRVYNADNKPPYALPANATQSGVKSRSSKGGGADDFNEIRFEDKKGSEEVYIHAQKDENHVVENDQTLEVGHDQSVDIGNDQTIHVTKDRSLTVDGNKSETVEKDKSISVSGNHSESISKDMTLSVDKNQTITVTKDQTESVDGSVSVTIGKDRTVTISGKSAETIAKDRTLSVDGKSAVTVTKEHVFKAKKILIEAEDEIVLKTGSASITLKKSGDITIKGGKINVKGSGDVVLKGSKVTAN